MRKSVVTTFSPEALAEFEKVKAKYSGKFDILFDAYELQNDPGNYVFEYELIRSTSPNAEDFCYSGMMYSVDTGAFYLSATDQSYAIGVIDGPSLVDWALSNTQSKMNVHPIHPRQLARIFSNIKAGHNVLSYESPEDLMVRVLVPGGSTALGHYLNKEISYRNHLESEDYIRMSILMTKAMLEISKAYNGLLASSNSTTKDGLYNTQVMINKEVKSAYDSDCYSGTLKYIDTEGDSGLSYELSTNPFFNRSVRNYYELFVSSSTKTGLGKKGDVGNFDRISEYINLVDVAKIPNDNITELNLSDLDILEMGGNSPRVISNVINKHGTHLLTGLRSVEAFYKTHQKRVEKQDDPDHDPSVSEDDTDIIITSAIVPSQRYLSGLVSALSEIKAELS